MKKLKILHLANDEKFIDQAIKAFERAAPGANDLYIYSRKPLRFVRSPTKICSIVDVVTGKISKGLSGHDVVIIHSLDPVWYKTILKLPKDIPVVWFGWGYDYYDIIYGSRERMFLPLTSMELQKKKPSGRLSQDNKVSNKESAFSDKKVRNNSKGKFLFTRASG